MNNHNVIGDNEDLKKKNYIKQQQQLKALTKSTASKKPLSADSMIEDLLSKKETFQKRKDSTSAKPHSGPPWLLPDSGVVHPLYDRIWQFVKTNTAGQYLVDTPTISSVLMTSGLSTDSLGYIWSLANKTIPGTLTQMELFMVLALVALAQSGYAFTSTAVLNQLPQPPLPNLDLSIIPQFNTKYGSQVQQPFHSALGPTDSASTFGVPSAQKTSSNTSNNLSVSLDVNKLQSAPVLTLPNFNFGPAPYAQNLGPTTTSQNATIGTLSLTGLPAPAIPSISLGISTVGTVQNQSGILNTPNQETDVADDFDDFKQAPTFGIDSFPVETPSTAYNNSSITDLGSSLSTLNLAPSSDTVIKEKSKGTSESFNIDESFDNLSTERATVSSVIQTSKSSDNMLKVSANYDIDLFKSFNEVKPIFPESLNSTLALENDSLKEAEGNITFNPLFIDEDSKNNVTKSFPADNVPQESFDDEFTDFQSADFTSVSSAVNGNEDPPNRIKIQEKVMEKTCVKPEDFSDFSHFTGFQQASVPSVNNDEDLFPKLNNPLNDTSISKNENHSKWGESNNFSEINWSSQQGDSKEKDSNDVNSITKQSDDTNKSSEISDNGFTHVEDKYSALRVLEPSNDDFGDFHGAELDQVQAADEKTTQVTDMSIQVKCLEACIEILQKTYVILSGASSQEIIDEILSDSRGANHATCIFEVHNVSERLRKHIDNENLIKDLDNVWKDLLPFIGNNSNSLMEETVGPVCGLCKCNYGPAPVRFGLNTFHAPCANLYLHYVGSTLPNSAAY